MAKKQFSIDAALSGAFRFCGNGQGIPGLPHEVTALQAKELGLLDVLQAAIVNGNYKLVETSTAHIVETPLSATPTSPQLEVRQLGGDEKKKEA